MKRRTKRTVLAGALAASLTALFASSAGASYHQNLIREVHEGNGVTGDYVELQAYSPGQNFVAGKHIVSYDAGGGPLTTFTFPGNVANGANQATILVAQDASVTGADFIAGTDLNVDNTGGTVCFTDSSTSVALDCVAFDGTGGADVTVPSFSPAQFGAPFALPGPNLNNQALVRTISRGCATALDPADDTNRAADFSLGAGSPRGNTVAPTETPCPSTPAKKKCKKKHKKKSGAYSAKKKKCKKKKH